LAGPYDGGIECFGHELAPGLTANGIRNDAPDRAGHANSFQASNQKSCSSLEYQSVRISFVPASKLTHACVG